MCVRYDHIIQFIVLHVFFDKLGDCRYALCPGACVNQNIDRTDLDKGTVACIGVTELQEVNGYFARNRTGELFHIGCFRRRLIACGCTVLCHADKTGGESDGQAHNDEQGNKRPGYFPFSQETHLPPLRRLPVRR